MVFGWLTKSPGLVTAVTVATTGVTYKDRAF